MCQEYSPGSASKVNHTIIVQVAQLLIFCLACHVGERREIKIASELSLLLLPL